MSDGSRRFASGALILAGVTAVGLAVFFWVELGAVARPGGATQHAPLFAVWVERVVVPVAQFAHGRSDLAPAEVAWAVRVATVLLGAAGAALGTCGFLAARRGASRRD